MAFCHFRGKKTEGEIHRVCAKAVDIDEHSAIMIPVSFCVRLHLCVSSILAFSLPQSRLQILWARQLPPQREPRVLPRRAQNLPKCVPRLSPLLAGCPHPSRCSAKAQHRATFPKGKARAAGGERAENFAASSAKKLPAANFLTLFVLHFRL